MVQIGASDHPVLGWKIERSWYSVGRATFFPPRYSARPGNWSSLIAGLESEGPGDRFEVIACLTRWPVAKGSL
jgi:hypothetical protein